MPRTIIQTENAPKAIGPYSQAVVASAGRTIFCSGQIPLDPTTGQLVSTTDIRLQATQVMRNLQAVLEGAGACLADIVKTTIFLTDLANFNTVNEVYGAHFQGAPPARSTVQVSALPRGAQVEIEATAVLDG